VDLLAWWGRYRTVDRVGWAVIEDLPAIEVLDDDTTLDKVDTDGAGCDVASRAH